MKFTLLCAFLLMLPGYADDAPDSGLPPAGATSLLSGHDLTGWRLFLGEGKTAAPDLATATADGVVHIAGKVTGYFVTEKSFSDYHLHLEWRWPEGASPKTNAGIFFHVQKPDAIWPVCVEAQMANGNAGQIVGQGGADIPGAPVINKKHRAAKLAEASEKPIGEWNIADIICRGADVEVRINGVKQNAIDNLPVSAGAVGFQLEGFAFEFRRMWITPLEN